MTSGPLESPDRREHRMVAVFGSPSMGKSALLRQWVREALAQGRQVRIVSPTVAAWPARHEWPGTELVDDPRGGKKKVRAVDAYLLNLKRTRFTGLLVLDDADAWLTATPPAVWVDFMATFRHWGMDVVLSARRPQRLPREVDDNASHLVVFRCRNPKTLERIQEMLEDPEVLPECPSEHYHYFLVNQDTAEVFEGKTRRDW